MKIRSLQHVCHDLNQVSLLRTLSGLLCAHQQCFLVGGAIRDLFLGLASKDYDFITPFDPTHLAQTFAHRLSGHWFFLDEKRRQSRVVIPRANGELSCDFGPFRATGLFADLSLRDFRINAMAMRIHADICPVDFFDPLSGIKDLRKAELSFCSPKVLETDPLRVLKGVRHCKKLQLTPNKQTIKAMRAAVPMLQKVAEERVRKEIGLLLQDSAAMLTLRWLIVTGAAPALFGSWMGGGEVSGVAQRLEAFERNTYDLMASEYADFFLSSMQEEFEEGFSRQATINLALLLRERPMHDVQRVIARMKLSRMTCRALTGYLLLDSSKLIELSSLSCGFRGRHWWISSLGSDPAGCLIYLACNTSVYNPQLGLRALSLAKEFTTTGKIADLIDGNGVCQQLKIEPGPMVGQAVQALRSAEISGEICSVAEAQAFLRSWIKKPIDKIG